ncbi:MAG TPA: baseplate J/gp47 family protein [Frateuria sp.]|uniref:baseplate J/gp47 family protein n=1 Tax=Frateuria sp. TaxID=2211372 RepID=UPI002DE46419|nr:baseplate J/gp47 family protein [Frateuria sp.]
MSTTNVPDITFGSTGITLPQEADIVAGVLADMNSAFGGGMSTSLTSPQGQLAQSFAAIIGDKNDQIATIVNQVNPDTADGRFQDAIGRIYFINRIAASGTLVTGTCTGLAGTVIPVGSIVQDANGYQYASLSAATIPAGGSIAVPFQCLTTGPIACPIGALNSIYRAVTGWESVSNPTAGTPGVNEESRSDFEFRRQNSVAANAVNSTQAVYAAVLAVPNVVDAYVIDNSTNAAVNTGSTNYPVAANSIYVAVAGGDPAAIAKAIWSKKSLGCSYNGNTTYTYTDESQGITPYPTYAVKWEVPASINVYIAVNLVNNPALPSNVTQLIQNAVLAAFNGQDGGTRARIGATLYAGRYFAGISGVDPHVQILSVTIGSTASPTTSSLAVGIDQLPTLNASNITVTLT